MEVPKERSEISSSLYHQLIELDQLVQHPEGKEGEIQKIMEEVLQNVASHGSIWKDLKKREFWISDIFFKSLAGSGIKKTSPIQSC